MQRTLHVAGLSGRPDLVLVSMFAGVIELSPILGDGRGGQAAAVAGWPAVRLGTTSNPSANFTPRIS
ncbi:MAG: hypothetical protein KJZ80_11470, partial [Hyphomicrobiaceae bacterium]|nr:hypothetical protein [Hyphomicrobiaceae bacterium]